MSKFNEWLDDIKEALGDDPDPLPPMAPETKVEIPVADGPMNPSPIYGIHGGGAAMQQPQLPDQPGEIPKPRPLVTDAEVRAGVARVNNILNQSGYGSFVSDAQVEHIVTMVLVDAARVRRRQDQ